MIFAAVWVTVMVILVNLYNGQIITLNWLNMISTMVNYVSMLGHAMQSHPGCSRTLCWMTDGPLWRTTTTKTTQQLCILLSIFTLNEGKITKSLTNIIFDSSPIILYFFRLSFIGNFVRMRHFNPARAIQLTTEMFWLDWNIWILRYFSHEFDYFLSDNINLGFCESDFDLKMWEKLIIH